jgi:hypothetical protein
MEKKSTAPVIIYFLLFVLGGTLTAWGISLETGIYQPFLLSIGGAFIGVGLSGCATSFEVLNHWNHLHDILQKLVKSRLLSEEEQIERLRKQFHHYYVTNKCGSLVWNYDMIDFSGPSSPGVLSAQSYYKGREDNVIPSRIDAFVVDGRLIMLIKDMVHDEQADICVYPFFLKPGEYSKCGYELRETLDQNHMTCPAILSSSPINNWVTVGTVDEDTSKILNTKWRESILEMNNFKIAWVNEESSLDTT